MNFPPKFFLKKPLSFELNKNINEKIDIFKMIFAEKNAQKGIYIECKPLDKKIKIYPENFSISNHDLKESKRNLYVDDNTLDFIILKNLPFGKKEIVLFKELYRVLKKEGNLFLLVSMYPLRILQKLFFSGSTTINYRKKLIKIGFKDVDSYLIYPNCSKITFLIPLKKQGALLAGLYYIANHSKGIFGKIKDLLMIMMARLRILSFTAINQALIVKK